MKRILLLGVAALALQGCALNITTVSDSNLYQTSGDNPRTWAEHSETALKACQIAVGTIAVQGGITAEDMANPVVTALLDEAVQGCAREMGVVI